VDNGRNGAYGDNSCPKWPKSLALGLDALSANQQKALAALLSSTSTEAAAEKCGLSVRTIKRYLATREFAEAYREQRMLVLSETIAGLEKAGVSAVATLRGALEDADVGTRIRAARSIIEFLFRGTETERKIRELDEIEAQIEELKELIGK
jgi:AcrR family transcriptional regulator